jgi:tight adherence protein C
MFNDLLNLDYLTGWTGFAVVACGIALLVFACLKVFGRVPPPAEASFGNQPQTSEELSRLRDILRPRPVEGRDETQIGPELLQAGYYRPSALPTYMAIRTFLIAAPIAIAGFLALSAPDRTTTTRFLIGGAIAAALGFSIPRVIIGAQARSRKRQIEKGLPVALDLITLGLLAGQNVQSSFRRVGEELRRAFPVLSDEMKLTLNQADLNTFPHALEQWAQRCGVVEVQNLSVVLSQADRLGSDVTPGLLELSQTFRTSLRQRADASANRAGFWMLFPTVFCMWIPAAMILAMPVFFQFQEQRRQATEAMRPLGGDPTKSTADQVTELQDAASLTPARISALLNPPIPAKTDNDGR